MVLLCLKMTPLFTRSGVSHGPQKKADPQYLISGKSRSQIKNQTPEKTTATILDLWKNQICVLFNTCSIFEVRYRGSGYFRHSVLEVQFLLGFGFLYLGSGFSEVRYQGSGFFWDQRRGQSLMSRGSRLKRNVETNSNEPI